MVGEPGACLRAASRIASGSKARPCPRPPRQRPPAVRAGGPGMPRASDMWPGPGAGTPRAAKDLPRQGRALARGPPGPGLLAWEPSAPRRSLCCHLDGIQQRVQAWPGKVRQQCEELPVGKRTDVGQQAGRVDRGRLGCAVVEDSRRPSAQVEDGIGDGCWYRKALVGGFVDDGREVVGNDRDPLAEPAAAHAVLWAGTGWAEPPETDKHTGTNAAHGRVPESWPSGSGSWSWYQAWRSRSLGSWVRALNSSSPSGSMTVRSSNGRSHVVT